MLMELHEPWGICIPPPARVRGDPLPKGWTTLGSGAMRCEQRKPILAEGLPEEKDMAWWTVNRKLAEAFVGKVGFRLNPTVRPSALRIAHPHNEAQIEALRAVYNGDIPEPEGGSLPRVWQWEHENQVWWVVELPPQLEWAWRSLGV